MAGEEGGGAWSPPSGVSIGGNICDGEGAGGFNDDDDDLLLGDALSFPGELFIVDDLCV